MDVLFFSMVFGLSIVLFREDWLMNAERWAENDTLIIIFMLWLIINVYTTLSK